MQMNPNSGHKGLLKESKVNYCVSSWGLCARGQRIHRLTPKPRQTDERLKCGTCFQTSSRTEDSKSSGQSLKTAIFAWLAGLVRASKCPTYNLVANQTKKKKKKRELGNLDS